MSARCRCGAELDSGRGLVVCSSCGVRHHVSVMGDVGQVISRIDKASKSGRWHRFVAGSDGKGRKILGGLNASDPDDRSAD